MSRTWMVAWRTRMADGEEFASVDAFEAETVAMANAKWVKEHWNDDAIIDAIWDEKKVVLGSRGKGAEGAEGGGLAGSRGNVRYQIAYNLLDGLKVTVTANKVQSTPPLWRVEGKVGDRVVVSSYVHSGLTCVKRIVNKTRNALTGYARRLKGHYAKLAAKRKGNTLGEGRPA